MSATRRPVLCDAVTAGPYTIEIRAEVDTRTHALAGLALFGAPDGSDLEAQLGDLARLVTLALHHGASPAEVWRALDRQAPAPVTLGEAIGRRVADMGARLAVALEGIAVLPPRVEPEDWHTPWRERFEAGPA
ncbi:hypothetical protein [Zavarzinia sp. CC-PAN008]|uniref:hypothetical protein n=1 Tax=Zavarzinia sp. CC-PAN008 TaxID=3243332 RepID=UPI003F746C51